MPRRDGRGSALGVDRLAALGRVRLGDQLVEDDRWDVRRVCQERVAICEGEPLRLDEQVEVVGGVVAQRPEVVRLEDVEHLQGDEALGVRRQLAHLHVAVRGAERLHPVGTMTPEIGGVEHAAARGEMRHERLRQRPAIERVNAAAGDGLQRSREPRVPEDLPGSRRPAAGKERACRVGVAREHVLTVLPLAGDDLGHREPVLRVADRGRQRLRKRHASVMPKQFRPAAHDAGYGHG